MEGKPATAEPGKQRRRWPSFSLRSLLIGVTLVGCGLGWLGSRVYKARRQHAAVASIRQLGGYLFYDFQIQSPGNNTINTAPPGPAWLHALLGDDFFRNVESVYLGRGPYHDPTLVTDAELETLQGLTQLRELSLNQTRVTGDGLKYLRGLVQLEALDLDNTLVTDAALENLEGFVRLKSLGLSNTKITDTGLSHVQGLAAIEDLSLSYTKITDAGLARLKGLPRLQYLQLDGTQITDAGLESLKAFANLNYLSLSRTNITDAGLEILKGLTQLKRLDLTGTHVTFTGLMKLREALPNCDLPNFNNMPQDRWKPPPLDTPPK